MASESESPLTFAQSDDQGEYAASEQDDTRRGRQHVTVFGFHSDSGVSDPHAVMIAMRHRDNKRQSSQHQQQDSNERKRFHKWDSG